MPSLDILYILTWWLAIGFVTLSFIPTAAILFSKFVDKGYIFAKVIGILVLSYLVFIGGYLKIVPFTFPAVLGILVILAGLNYLVFRKRSLKFNKQDLRFFIIEELLFLAVLVFWSYVRAHQPAIEGLEKLMDYGFVRTMLASGTFPPQDMWLATIVKPEIGEVIPENISGFYINYYYFGQLVAAVLTRLSMLPSAVTYNLLIATLASFTFVCSFSLGINLFYIKIRSCSLKQLLVVGILSGLLVTFAGNLHTIYAFTEGYPLGDTLPLAPWQLTWDFNPDNYWYPNATRFIPFTIHEFPAYSFIVSDLHGHVNNIPFVMLILASLLRILQIRPHRVWAWAGGFGFLLAVFYMTNAWDLLIYGALTVATLFIISLKKIKSFLVAVLILAISFMVFSHPFRTNFRPISSSLGINCGYEAASVFIKGKAFNNAENTRQISFGPFTAEAGKCQISKPWMHMILWGFFYFGVLGYLRFILRFKDLMKSPVDKFMLLIIVLSIGLLWAPEIIYIRDIYPAHFRANTMFKLGYQAYMMLSLVVGYTIVKLIFNFKHRLSKTIYTAILLLMTFVVLIYPLFGINSYYNGLTNYKELYGLGWLMERYPEDYNGVIWLDMRADKLCAAAAGKCPVVLEAVGDSYTTYARVSSNTGLPTVLGWPVHEWLWRGSYDEAGKRRVEVETMYTSKDLTEVKRLLERYAVEYVFVGQLEREAYPKMIESNFDQLGNVVYSSGDTRIYLLR